MRTERLRPAAGAAARFGTIAAALLTLAVAPAAFAVGSTGHRAAHQGLLLLARTQQGRLRGIAAGVVAAYLGVPYAAPPLGGNRWRAPQPPASWGGVRVANQHPPSCYQPLTPHGFGPWTAEYVVQGAISENCLYLNIWTPAPNGPAAQVRAERLPVLLWIHGGGFTTGSGSIPIYDGAALAAHGIVVVDVNYRLGVFGFLAHPALSARAPQHVSGNYGLLDIVAALRWLHANVAAFGGDPHAITIAGQSAGAAAVIDLDVSPLADGLYARAIAESGAGLNLPTATLAAAEQAGEQFARAHGARTLAALRALPAARLSGGPPGAQRGFAPIVDGWVLPQAPAQLLAAGRFHRTPFLTGMVADENSAMTPTYQHQSAAQCEATLERLFGAQLATFHKLYWQPGSGTDCTTPLQQLLRDRGLAATWQWAQTRAAQGSPLIYLYLYDHPEPGPDASRYGAFHSSEIPYVFETLNASPARPFTVRDRAICAVMSAYWLNFVKRGNPNGEQLPHWPPVAPDNPQIMELGNGFGPRPLLGEEGAARLRALRGFLAAGGRAGLL